MLVVQQPLKRKEPIRRGGQGQMIFSTFVHIP